MRFGDNRPKNPTERYYEFKSKKKSFVWYDKENDRNVNMNLPAYMIILDTLSCISGYSKKYRSGGFSNEVYNVKKEPLTVKTFNGGFSETGLYHDIELQLNKTNGLCIHKSLYVLIKDGKDVVMGNIKLKSSAMVEWIEKIDNENIDGSKYGIIISKDFSLKYMDEKEKEGAYYIPTFTPFELTNQDMIAKASEKYNILQNYFRELKKQDGVG